MTRFAVVVALVGVALVLRAAHQRWKAWPAPDDGISFYRDMDARQMEALRRTNGW